MSLPAPLAASWRRVHQPELSHRASARTSPTIHLGVFEGERKQRSRGWDEDAASAARNVCAVIAIAIFVMAGSLVAGLVDRSPTSVSGNVTLAEEPAR